MGDLVSGSRRHTKKPTRSDSRYGVQSVHQLPARARKKLHPRIGLPVIGLEVQRQLAVGVENLGLSFRVSLGRADRRRNKIRLRQQEYSGQTEKQANEGDMLHRNLPSEIR